MRAASQLFSTDTQTPAVHFSRLPASLAVLRAIARAAGVRPTLSASVMGSGLAGTCHGSLPLTSNRMPYGTRIVFTEASPGADLTGTQYI